jgi:sulfur relay (sulfurtransferase) complex TusBCD TusD component (DsrE family)
VANYLLIASDDPFESHRAERMRALATSLARRGGTVNVFLTQNAVLAARRASKTNSCAALVTECIDVLADDFSLRERGIESQALLPGVKVASMEAVVARLAHGWKAFWS